MRRSAAQKHSFCAHKAAPFSLPIHGRVCLKKTLCPLCSAKKASVNAAFLFSDPLHPWIYFDYDPGPLFCVHLQMFQNFITVFIIAPQKKTVNPYPHIYRNFYFSIQKQNTLSGIAAYRKGCSVWILPWCEEESCYLGIGCGPASHGKSITAFTIQFVKKL